MLFKPSCFQRLHRNLFRLFASGLLALACQNSIADETIRIGDSRPGFNLPDLNGVQQDIGQWQGKVIVVNFWASWCKPCREEIPLLNTLQQEYGPDGVQFVGLAVDNKYSVEMFMQKVPIQYPVLVGGLAALDIVAQYGNKHGGLPYTVFIDRQGKIRAMVSGKLTRKYTSEMIESLL